MDYKKNIEVLEEILNDYDSNRDRGIFKFNINERLQALRNCMASHKALGEAKDELPKKLIQGQILAGVNITIPEYDKVILWVNAYIEKSKPIVAKLRQDVDGLEGNCRWLKNKNKKLEAELSQCKQTIAEYVEHGKEAVSIEELKQHLPNIFAISMLKKFNISSKEADK